MSTSLPRDQRDSINVFSVDAFQRNDTRRRQSSTAAIQNIQETQARDLSWGIPGEPYSRLNYLDMIKEMKRKDRELAALRNMVNQAKYEAMRRDMKEKESEGSGSGRPRRHTQRLRLGPLAPADDPQLGPPRLTISGVRPPSTIEAQIDELRMPVSWPPRPVVVVAFDVITQAYTVSTATSTYILEGAEVAFCGSKAVGLEVMLTAFCDLVFAQNDRRDPHVRLRYRDHVVHHEQDDMCVVERVVGKAGVLPFDPRRSAIFLVLETDDDYSEWKRMLRAWLVGCDAQSSSSPLSWSSCLAYGVTNFPMFAPDDERRRLRAKLNGMREMLLDAKRWRLHSWHYDKLMIVFEGQGFSLDGRPFQRDDGLVLMNLSQEAQKGMALFGKMARDELERRDDGFDTPAHKRLRERWTIPVREVCGPTRPFEIFKRGVGGVPGAQLDCAVEDPEQACCRCCREFFVGLDVQEAEKDRSSSSTALSPGSATLLQRGVATIAYEALIAPTYYDRPRSSQLAIVMPQRCETLRVENRQKIFRKGQWFDMQQVLRRIRSDGPFRKLLEISPAHEWVKLADRLSRRVNAELPSPPPQPERLRQLQQPLRTKQQVTIDDRDTARRTLELQYTPREPPIRKIPVPPGGWHRSESARRIGPGTNEPKQPKTAKNQRALREAKAARKRNRRRKIKQKRRLARSRSESFLPEIY